MKGWKFIGIHAALVHNLNEGHFFAIQGAWWSIAVEWQLYLVYPLFLLMRRAVGSTVSFAVGLVLGAAWNALAGVFFAPGGTLQFAFNQLPFAYWTQWLAGAWVAERVATGCGALPRAPVLLAIAICLFVLSGEVERWQPLGGWAAIAASALALDMAVRNLRPESFLERWLAGVGVCSYSLYLHHGVVYVWMRHVTSPLLGDSPWAQVCFGLASGFVLALILSRLLYRWIELPSIAMGRSRLSVI